MHNRNKIKQFMNDPEMNHSVKTVIQMTFLKADGSTDVQYKAAKMIAIELLDAAWKELEREKNKLETEVQPRKQVGL